MEKEPQPDSMATITIKPEYPPSEIYSSEPPPAYHRSNSSAVQVAKIIAVTVVLVSVVLGSFLLASAYITATASCRQLEQELELLNEAADRFQPPLSPEALVREDPQKQSSNDLETKESRSQENENKNKSVDSTSSESSEDSESDSSSSDNGESDEKTVLLKLPLHLDFDDLGALLEKSRKPKINCVVEKKRAEEIVDHKPKALNLPFGLNLTTDPRYERISGERIAIFCDSGNEQKQSPQEDDQVEETMLIQPVMIPIPQTHFPTHMAQQFAQRPPYPMETPMSPRVQQIREQNQLPPNQILHQIAQEVIAQKIMEMQRVREGQNQEMPQFNSESVAQKAPIPDEVLAQLNRFPNRDVIVTVSQEFDDGLQELNEGQADPQKGAKTNFQQMNAAPQQMHTVPPSQNQRAGPDMRAQPQLVMSEVQQAAPMEMLNVPPVVAEALQELKVYEQQRQNAQERNDRQMYERNPTAVPMRMMPPGLDSQTTASEEPRPHYVQPRSVRSVDALLPKVEKRVKRCSCDCAC
ncbi:uncharacterized protein Msr-110 [Tribolium castaneum]|uniref:Uncharacterized protein n=1 Tax=Tribolium castaneum TaxID=7070 RepID=D7EHQ0_TRICA|nr:PREDICTED: uncharacterized protein LOC658382 [Tribolium castaneum]EFA12140.1 hypothetical protein TcasGA2_TC002287 [Tribolium castaneum]|eukprot:XP_969869.1 PREDICTED: uncharacterized protein LOC658382 [Tribolium castaneum]